MLFKKQICENCSGEYDGLETCCPTCGQQRENSPENSVGKGVVAISWPHQIIIMVLGIFGISLISTLCTVFALFADGSINDFISYGTITDSVFYASTYPGYIIVFCGFLFLLFKYRNAFLKKLKAIPPYFYGLAIGIAIIGFQLFYNILLTSNGIDISNNANENQVDSGILLFPISSIIIFGIIGPICEEFTYRFGLFGFLTRINRALAYVVASLIFAFMHFKFDYLFTGEWSLFWNEMLNLPIYLVCAFGLTFAYDKFGPQASCVAHIVNNLFAIISLLISVSL